MKKFILLLLLLLVIGGCGNMDSVQEQVEKNYTNSDGLIHAYPQDPDSEYLSESIGLYMEYLLLVEDDKRFQEQFELLQQHFVETENGSSFVLWRLNEDAATNALIDDIRIIDALTRGSELFGNTDYTAMAENLSQSISTVQVHDGYTVDFYDWSFAMPAERLTLSYLNTSEAVSEKSVELLKNTDASRVFFPEYYDTSEETYLNSDEVHLIDQLLIALNREKAGQHSELFSTWLKEEWTSEHQLFGRYDRESTEPSVDYESLAVYYYLHSYFTLLDEGELAAQVVQRAQDIATEDMLSGAHFFDYIHYQLLLEEQ